MQKSKLVKVKDKLGKWVRDPFFLNFFGLKFVFLCLACVLFRCEESNSVVDGLFNRLAELSAFWVLALQILVIWTIIWIAYILLSFHLNHFNLERIYQAILRNLYVSPLVLPYSNFGVVFDNYMTLVHFPAISLNGGQESAVWGWGDSGNIKANVGGERNGQQNEGSICLIVRPKAFSEQISMDLELVAKKLDGCNSFKQFDGRPSFPGSNKDKEILLGQIFSNNIIGYDAPIHGECIILSPDGEIIIPKQQAGQLKYTWNIPIESSAIMDKDDFCASYFSAVQNELESKYKLAGLSFDRRGILSFYLNHDNGEIGLCTLIQLEKLPSEENWETISFENDSKENYVAKLISRSDIDGESRYNLLIYAYAQLDLMEFSKRFCTLNICNWSKWKEFFAKKNGASNATPAPGGYKSFELQFREESKGTETEFAKIKQFVQQRSFGLFRSCFRIRSRHSIYSAIIAVLCFIYGSVVQPVFLQVKMKALAEVYEKRNMGVLLDVLSNEQRLAILMATVFLALILVVLMVNWRLSKKYLRLRLNEGDLFYGAACMFSADYHNGCDLENVRLEVVDCMHRFTGALRGCKFYLKERDDGVKYMLSDFQIRKDGVDCRLDQCHFSDVQAVKRMVEAEKSGELENGCSAILQAYRDSLSKLKCHNRLSLVERANLPPNSLCAHTLIITKDGYVVVMKRDSSTAYHKDRYSFSIEEQMSSLDVLADERRLCAWIERMCEEELGLTKRNTNCGELGQMRLMSIFQEKDILNVALCIYMKLNITKKQLQAVLQYFPRKDYEGEFAFVYMEDAWNNYLKVKKDKFHPSSIYRLFWAAICEQRFDLAEKIMRFEK